MAHTNVKDEAAEAAIAAVAQKFSVAGGSAALVGGLTANEIAAFGGLLIAAIGLAVQFYYKRKDDRRKTAQHNKFMASMHLPPESEE